jgi:hypothetical protein
LILILSGPALYLDFGLNFDREGHGFSRAERPLHNDSKFLTAGSRAE